MIKCSKSRTTVRYHSSWGVAVVLSNVLDRLMDELAYTLHAHQSSYLGVSSMPSGVSMSGNTVCTTLGLAPSVFRWDEPFVVLSDGRGNSVCWVVSWLWWIRGVGPPESPCFCGARVTNCSCLKQPFLPSSHLAALLGIESNLFMCFFSIIEWPLCLISCVAWVYIYM